jgi:hypothetical protein
MPYQATHINAPFMPRATMPLFRILSHRSGIIFKAFTPSPLTVRQLRGI